MAKVDTQDIGHFPYPRPYHLLPWHTIADGDVMPLGEWVWVGDFMYNIYPAIRTEQGLEVPQGGDFKARVAAGIIGKPLIWLPLKMKRRLHIHLGGPQGDAHA